MQEHELSFIWSKKGKHIIRDKAYRTSRGHGFTSADHEDIEQDLRLHLCLKLPRYDRRRPRKTFVSFILDKRCSSIRRHRRARKRTPDRVEYSLDETVRDCDGRLVYRHELKPESSSVPQWLRELKIDVADVMDRLSDRHRAVAWRFAAGTVHSAAKELRMSRRKVERHLKEVREVFFASGLGEYLGTRATSRSGGVDTERRPSRGP